MKQTNNHLDDWLGAMSHKGLFFVLGLLLTPLSIFAQEDDNEDDIFEISPFVVEDDSDIGYLASQTMAGGRLRTDLRNVGSSIQVVTAEFMEDIGATGIDELLQYTTSTEVAGNLGNFTGVSEGLDGQVNTGGARGNPDGTSRVRGLAAPDRTRNFYKTDIPFDTYTTERIDINRGANSFLFGLGSPAGLINNGITRANFNDSGQVEIRIGSGGKRPSVRLSGNYNKVLIEDKLAIRVAYLDDRTQNRQRPTYEDDKRYFGTVTWQPFGSPNTVIRAYFETGSIDGNAADTVGPVENLSSFFEAENYPRMSFDTVANARNFNHVEGPNNERNSRPDRNPDGLPLRDIGHGSEIENAIGVGWGLIWDGSNGRYPSGTFNGNIRGADQTNGRTTGKANQITGPNPFWKPKTFFGRTAHIWMLGHGNYSQTAGEGNAFRGLTDLEIFDFSKYNLGWDNDFYTRDFDNYNISLEQVLFNGNVGFEFGYDFQTLYRSDFNAFSNGAARITLDINRSLPIPNDLNYAESGDLSYPENPNFGRVWIETNGNFRESTFDRETARFTGFLKHSFREQLDESFLGKILGSHTITSLLDDYTEEERFVPWQLSSFADQDPGIHLGHPDAGIANNGQRNIRNIVYLGPPQLAAFTDPSFTMQDLEFGPAMFDLRGVAGMEFDHIYWDMGPDATRENTGDDLNDNGNEGFKLGNLIPNLTPHKNHRIQKTEVESVAFNSQSFLFDNLLVVNMGWRNDKVKTWLNTEAQVMGIEEIPDLSEQGWNLTSGHATFREIDSEIFGYGGVLNWPHQLIKLPSGVDIAFHYNETENFVPAATRVDQFRQPLESPSGLSKDWGVTLFLFDNKVVSRFNWYDADLKGATANLGGVFNGSIQRMFTHWGSANADIQRADANADGVIDPSFIEENREIELDEDDPGVIIGQETDEEVIARLAPNFERTIADRDAITPYLTDDLKASYNFRLNNSGTVEVQPAGGVSDTQDIQAKGFEWELTMNPTRAWRVSLNFADTETVLTNIGPRMTKLFNEFWIPIIEDFGDLDWNNPMGLNTGNTLKEQVNADVLEYLEQKAQEGTPTKEQRRYRVNFVTNYRFNEGFLQGFSVGGAARWQSDNSVGFPLIPREDGIVQPDVDNPWLNEDVYNYDLTFAYRKKITDKINWTIQLNIRNLQNLRNDDISTIRRQPNGDVARIRFDPPSQFLLTNTFRF
ncbi:MAG: TonB-dependent receptor plug domain-containing protein [Verrucomicrobia bacterium]|nr:TonB-dependent receptor plug domain-containing protein [Verrucomicrobiota bacterium]